jgi:hypothetical protein
LPWEKSKTLSEKQLKAKRSASIAQMVEFLPRKHMAPELPRKKEKERKKERKKRKGRKEGKKRKKERKKGRKEGRKERKKERKKKER